MAIWNPGVPGLGRASRKSKAGVSAVAKGLLGGDWTVRLKQGDG